MVVFPRATVTHVEWLAPRLRKADRDEIAATCGLAPEQALWHSFYASDMRWSIILNGEIVGMFGCGDFTPWLLGSERLPEAGMAIARHSHRYIEFMLRRYPLLYNYVDVRNKLAIRWLRWCGFMLFEPIPYGLSGELFYPFLMLSGAGMRRGQICVWQSAE